MTSDGARLPEKNAFEFTMRPHSQILKSDRKSSREDGASQEKLTGKQAIQKSLLQMKRKLNMSSVGNKFMSIVKYDG